MSISARLCAASVTSILLLTSAASIGYAAANGRLTKHDRELLAQARASGRSTVVVLVSVAPGASASAVVNSLGALGGNVRFREDQVGYIRAVIPTGQVEAAAKIPGVEALDLNEVIPLTDPQPAAEPDGTVQVFPPGPTTPVQNPYMPTQETGAPQFVSAHPTWDGRGVTVGILDTGVSLDHPSLTTTSTGEKKVIDWVTYTDPVTDGDPTWIDMKDQVSGATFSYKGMTYTAPAAGSYRIGILNERDPRLGGELGNDLNRDGNPAGSSGIFAVLWNATTNTVWVDTNQNNSFADEMAMTDYKVRYDVNYFGVDNPATAVAERVPFVVQTNGKDKYVNIGIVSGAHGSHVAGIIGGTRLFGGAMTGAAPGAKFVSVRVCLFVEGCTASAMIEGMIYATRQSNVDLVNMSIGGLPALNDGNTARASLYNRLILLTKAQMFISAGNDGPGVNTVGDPSVATDVISVGASVSKASWLANYGADARKEEGLFVFSSRGPREDGGFKPNIVAPGSAVSTVPMWQDGQPVAGTYALPPGYAMFNGTSMASPQTAGAAALLVSAAKQYGAQFKPDQLRAALYSSARPLAGYQAYEQGNGLIQVDAAWNLLRTNLKTDVIVSSAPVNTIISNLLATPNFGSGIYEREGWKAGTSASRQIVFTRLTGGGGPIMYRLTWVGNDGTFSSESVISLPLRTPVPLAVRVNAATAGVHSAILTLVDPSSPGIKYEVLNTIVATQPLDSSNNFSLSLNGTADRPDKASFFFAVPQGASALKTDLVTTEGRTRLYRFHPYGINLDPNAGYQTGGTQSRTTTVKPLAGVWEATVDTSRSSPTEVSVFNITGSVFSATVSPSPDVIASASIGIPLTRSYTATNSMAAFTGRMAGTALASSRVVSTDAIATGQQRTYEVMVAAGSTSLTAKLNGAADPGADLDLFVYDCHTGSCSLAGQSTTATAIETVQIGNPAAGRWMVVVDGYSVPAGTTTYSYMDAFANPAFGGISIADAAALRSSGGSWSANASITVGSAPAAGRILTGNVFVVMGSTVISSGDVIISSVAP